MLIDLPVLVNDALLSLGCDPKLIAELDGHSTITLDFEQLPSLLIAPVDEQIWLWSRVAEYSEPVIAHKSADILSQLMQSDDSILGGHPNLCEGEGYLEMRAMVAPAYLENGQRFGEALSLFFDRLSNMTQLIRQ
jgi:hypothetical protein